MELCCCMYSLQQLSYQIINFIMFIVPGNKQNRWYLIKELVYNGIFGIAHTLIYQTPLENNVKFNHKLQVFFFTIDFLIDFKTPTDMCAICFIFFYHLYLLEYAAFHSPLHSVIFGNTFTL